MGPSGALGKLLPVLLSGTTGNLQLVTLRDRVSSYEVIFRNPAVLPERRDQHPAV